MGPWEQRASSADAGPPRQKPGRGMLVLALWTAAGLVLVAAMLGGWFGRSDRAKRFRSPNAASIQGEPIVLVATNDLRRTNEVAPAVPSTAAAAIVAADPTESDSAAAPRRKRPKPGSYPERLVRSWVEGKATAVVDVAAWSLPLPAKTNIVVLSGSPNVPGFRPLQFSDLTDFEVAVSDAMIRARDGRGDGESTILAQVPAEVRALDGARVALQGFLLPLRMDEGLAVEFMLMRDQTLCCFGRLPRVNEWVLVRTQGRGVKPDMDHPVTVCGVLTVADHRENGVFVGLYRMAAERVVDL
jgi:hypothetical protein